MKSLKSSLFANPAVQAAWTRHRCRQLHGEYEQRREHYAELAKERGLRYAELDAISAVRSRIEKRGYVPVKRETGDIHTFACIPQFSWHKHLLPDLRELGPVSLFDYVSLGFSPDIFYGALNWNGARLAQRKRMLDQMIPALRRAHENRPVDWVLFYGGGQELSADTISRITEEFGVPTANMTFDDKHGWAGSSVGEHCTGARDITPAIDLFATSARVACEWHMVEGGRAVYLAEGFDMAHYHPMPVDRDISVSFVGQRYGFRDSVVNYLASHGVDISAFGPGWPGGWADDMIEIFNRSAINLGMGGIGYSETLTNVKGRDFEIPGTGGGVYLTSFNPDLAQHFVVGEEILCYRNRDEMLEITRHYLAHPDEAREIATRARERCLREHRWLHRYQRMLRILGILVD